MILRRIQIEGYKALRNPVELKDLGLGIHLIHGPNETGKSTLMAAVARALFDRYNSTDQEIRALRPWGTELAPRVVLELESAGKRYRLEKKFLDEESSSLSEWNGSKFERVSDSVKADDKVRSLMLGSTPRSGASSLGNWGLARLLWMTQLPSRMQAPGLDETIRQHLLGVLGSAVLSESEQRLISKLDKAYDVYYTAAKQSEKKGSPLQEARERLEKSEANLTLWKTRWDEVSQLNETANESESRLRESEKCRLDLDSQIKSLSAKAQEELELENLLKVKEQELLVLLGKWKALNSSQLEIQGADQAISRHQEVIQALGPQITESETEIARLELGFNEAVLKLQLASDEASARGREMAQGALIAEAKGLLTQDRELTAHLAQAVRLESERKSKRDEYASRKRPKKEELDEIDRWSAEAATIGARMTDLGIEVCVTPERGGLELEWRTEAGETKATSEIGSEIVFKSPDLGEILIPGFGRIKFRSGAQDSKLLKERLKTLETQMQARLTVFGVGSLDELHQLFTATLEVESAGRAAAAALNSVLGPRFKSSSEISDELTRIREATARQLTLLDMTEGELTSATVTELRQLHEKMLPAKHACDEALLAKTGRETELRGANTRIEEARRRFVAARQGVDLLAKQLEAKMASLGSRERLARELAEAALEKTGLESERSALMGRLPGAESRASLRLATLKREREAARSLEDAARAKMLQATALLTNAEGQGYYSRLAGAEEERAMATELLAERQSQAHGTRLLRGLAHARRERMNSNLLSPIESAVIEIFDYVRGSKFVGSPARLSFGSELHELGVQLPDQALADRLSLESLSLGTQEQAMFAIRLAFGELLATRGENPEAQLVVLDDPLVNADPARQERAREILKKASSKLQILILTARPEDYRSLSPKEYDLAALKD